MFFFKFFDEKTAKPVSMGESHNALISATYCYDYATTAKMDVCIDPDIYGKQPQKVCTVAGKSLSSQGAPIAVNKVDVEMLPFSKDSIKPQFTIHVQNVGDGTVIASGKALSFCR